MNNDIFFSLYGLTHQSIFFDRLVVFVAVWLGYLLILGSIFFLFFHRDKGIGKRTSASLKQKIKEIAIVFCSAIAAWIITWLLKHLIGSPRPFDAFSSVTPLFAETGFGFPSGHATFFSALAAAMGMYHKRLGVLCTIAAFLIGIARIIGGVHFPFDILAGFILGPIIAVITYRTLRWFGAKFGRI